LGIIPVVGWALMPLFGVAVMVFGIMGIINGFGGKTKEIPIIGKFRIIN